MIELLAALAVAYLGWRLWKGPATKAPARGAMPPRPPRPIAAEADALALLGLDTDASDEEVRAAHRRLIAKVHPDRGGSAELARRINAARDLLLKQSD